MAAKLKDLEDLLAEVTDDKPTEIATRARWLREARHLPTGPRGYAADISSRDCATLVLGLMVSRKAADVVDAVGYLGRCRPAWRTSNVGDLHHLPADILGLFVSGQDESLHQDAKRRNPHVTLIDCLAGLIDLAKSPGGAGLLETASPQLSVSPTWLTPSARVELPNPNPEGEPWLTFFFTPDQEAGSEMTQKILQRPYRPPRLQRSASVQWQIWLDIAQMLAPDDETDAVAC